MASAADPAGVAERNPEVSIISQEEHRMRVALSGTDASVANALRRTMIAEVPSVAIDLVTIHENSSVLHDEFVAHRVGLIPFRFKRTHYEEDISSHFDLPWDDEAADVADDARLEIPLVLDVFNDGTLEKVHVTSRDMHFVNPEHEQIIEVAHFAHMAEEQLLADLNEGITIVKLGPQQRLRLECIAVLGIGKIHAKYSPVCTVCLRYEPDIRLNHELIELLSAEEKEDFVLRCQPGVFEYKRETEQVAVANPLIANNLDEIQKTGMRIARARGFAENIVTIDIIPEKFYLDIETPGSLTPAQVFLNSLRILQRKMDLVKNWTQRTKEMVGAAALDEYGGGAAGHPMSDTAMAEEPAMY